MPPTHFDFEFLTLGSLGNRFELLRPSSVTRLNMAERLMADDSQLHKPDVRLHLVVLRCQAGDEQAFRRLMEEFGRAPSGICAV